MNFVKKTVLAFLASLLLISPSLAFERGKRMLDQWYQSLETVDREILSSYLADDATIEIQDLSIVQNRDEFIESLDTWEDAIIGGSLSYKFVEAKTSGETITAIVCYKFPSNQMMTEEVFEFQNQLIKKSVQQTLSDNCDGF